MKVFIDTNIILEYFMHREEYATSERLLMELRQNGIQMFMSVGAFYTILYVVLKYLRKEQELVGEECIRNLRAVMQQILLLFDVAEHDKESLLRGVSDQKYKDLEDSCQCKVAQKVGCDFLLSFNTSDYHVEEHSSIRVLTPQQFLERIPWGGKRK